MDKAEELKQQFIFDWQPSDQQKSIHNQNFQFELNRLLDEASREALREAFDQGYDHALDPNKYYDFDGWKSNKEDKQNIK